MKEIILVRHGKSSWDYGVDDRDRPLQERGIKDGHRLARSLKGDLPMPDAVFSSPANRALHTCMILMRDLEIPLERLKIVANLYDFGGASVRNFVGGLDAKPGRIMLFGHNHAFTDLANHWGDQYLENVPTTGMVHLQFTANAWSALGKGKTLRTLFPKHLN